MKKRNVKNIIIGYAFPAMSAVLFSFFLPFYLKVQGLTILEIGALFTIGIALGRLVVSLIYSNLLKKIKLKTGLVLSVILSFIQSIILFIFPTAAGSLLAKFINSGEDITSKISEDVALQHNVSKQNQRKIGAISWATDSGAIILGIIIALLIIPIIGFKFSFLVFALITLPAIFFYSRVEDKTRFKLKGNKMQLPKIPIQLKIVLFAEIIYWFALASSFALVITFLVTDKFQGSMNWIGILFIGLYLSLTITSLLSNKYLEKKNLFQTAMWGMIILFFSALLIIVSQNLYIVLLAMILEGIGAGIWGPSKVAIY